MKTASASTPSIRHYSVDEAGDGVLFSRKGGIIVGAPGCSRYFILGLVDIPDPDALAYDLANLRATLLTDPYFRGVPSMQPQARKTAFAFHAKNDLPEVRREVFTLLLRYAGLRFFAIVRDKQKLLEYVRQRNQREPTYRYHPNELYDYLVRRLFRDRLHKDDQYDITFAKRGRSDRTAALMDALQAARHRLADRRGIVSQAPIRVIPATSVTSPGLQAADYFLWALQRLYERREERFVALLWPSFRLVHDLDDTRQAQYGVYCTQKRPLSLAALEGEPGIWDRPIATGRSHGMEPNFVPWQAQYGTKCRTCQCQEKRTCRALQKSRTWWNASGATWRSTGALSTRKPASAPSLSTQEPMSCTT